MIGFKLFSSNPNVKTSSKSILNLISKISRFEVYFEFISDRLNKIQDKSQQNELIDCLIINIRNFNISIYPEITNKMINLLSVIVDEKSKVSICELIGDLLKQNENVGNVIREAPLQIFNYLKSKISCNEMKTITKVEPKQINMQIDDNICKQQQSILNDIQIIPKENPIQSIPKQFIPNENKTFLSKSPLIIKPNNSKNVCHIETPLSIKPQFNQDYIDNIVSNLSKMVFTERVTIKYNLEFNIC